MNDTADIIPDTELRAIAVYPYGDDGRYKFVLMDSEGNLTAYYLSEQRLEHAFVVIGEALCPGMLVSMGFTAPYKP